MKKHFYFYILKNKQKNQPRQCFLFLCNSSLPGQSVYSVRNVCALQKPSQVAERDDLTREVTGFSSQWQKVQFVFSLCSRKLFDRQFERRIFIKNKISADNYKHVSWHSCALVYQCPSPVLRLIQRSVCCCR